MKRSVLFICIFLTAVFGLSAQTRLAGFGIAYDIQSVSASNEGTNSSLTANSLSFGVDAFSGGILSIYTGAAFGLVTGGSTRNGSVSANLDMDNYNMKFTMSCVTGVGSMINLGSLTLLVGAGLGVDSIMLATEDYENDVITMAFGPGLSLGCAYNFTPGLGVYADVRGIYNMVQVIGDIEGYKDGFSICPTIGLAISN